MPRFFSALVALFVLVPLCAPFASAFELTTSDRLAMLYSPQLQFSVEGDPLIKIGLVEGQSEILFTPDRPITVLPLGEGGPAIELPAHRQYRVTLANPTEGTYRYWAIVSRLFEANRGEIALVRDLWLARDYDARTFDLGSFFAIQGVTFDNRQTIIAVGGTDDSQSALQLAHELERRYGVPPELHVELVEYPSGEIRLTCDDPEIAVRHRDLLWIAIPEGGQFEVDSEAFTASASTRREGNRRFVGSLIFTPDRQARLALVNEVPAERLLEGILPAEIYASAPIEALKAQAIAARSELLAELGVRHLADPYMTCADQRCQVYRGVGDEHSRTSQAIQATRGVILLWGDHIAHTVYSASCGGISGDYAATWGHEPIDYLNSHFDGPEPPDGFPSDLDESRLAEFLTSPVDAYCNLEDFGGSNTFRWRVEYSAQELTRTVNEEYTVGRVNDLLVLRRDPSGRVNLLQIVGEEGTIQVERELPIRRALGGLRSALFIMDIRRDDRADLSRVTFVGGGFGHGVGLCQTGAIGAARRGIDHAQILSHYYPGTRLQQLWN